MDIFKGSALSSGIIGGKVSKWAKTPFPIPLYSISAAEADTEIRRIHQSVEYVKEQIRLLIDNLRLMRLKESANILTIQLEVLYDPTLWDLLRVKISQEMKNAPAALQESIQELEEMFEQIDNMLIKSRIIDIQDICNLLLANLCGQPVKINLSFTDNTILFAERLSAVEIASINFTYVKGVVLEKENHSSHASIMLRELRIPAIAGTNRLFEKISSGDWVFLNGDNGEIQVLR